MRGCGVSRRFHSVMVRRISRAVTEKTVSEFSMGFRQ